MSRFAQVLIERLQWTRLRLLDVYGYAGTRLTPRRRRGRWRRVPFRVARRRRETHDTWTLELEPVAGERLSAAPGQFTMLYAFGIGEVPISVSGDTDGDALVHTVRAVGAVTEAICAARPGAVLGVRGPFGNAWPVEDAAGGDVVVVAGGIGLAPLRPALYEVLRRRGEYGEVALLYGSRTPADLLYSEELERLRGRFDLQVDVTVDSAEGGWRGKVGVVPKLDRRRALRPGVHGRARLRAGDHDALHGAGAPRARRRRPSGSTSRWSATCSAASATAATASSGRR